jgi:hypothetical protein
VTHHLVVGLAVIDYAAADWVGFVVGRGRLAHMHMVRSQEEDARGSSTSREQQPVAPAGEVDETDETVETVEIDEVDEVDEVDKVDEAAEAAEAAECWVWMVSSTLGLV